MGWIVLLVLLFAAFGGVIYFVTLYNGLISLDKNTGRAWSNIDVLLKQRHDELPKLVSAAEAYMAHERDTLERVMNARNAVASAQGVEQTGEANAQLGGALRQLFAVVESYPELQADASFQHLRERISEIEEQIADRREFYNHAVNQFNIRIEQLPDVLVAQMLRFSPRGYFRATEEDRRDVEIRFRNATPPQQQT